MPVVKRGDKWAIGSGKAMYKSKASADRAYKAYLAKKHDKKKAVYKRQEDRGMHDYGEIDYENKVIRVNPRKGQLLNTVVHEELHRLHPDWTEQKVRKTSTKQEKSLTMAEAAKLIGKFRKKRRK